LRSTIALRAVNLASYGSLFYKITARFLPDIITMKGCDVFTFESICDYDSEKH